MHHYFHTFVFAAFPLLVIVGTNAGVVPLEGASIARAAAASIALTAALLVLLKPLVPDRSSRAACLSFVLIPFNVYALAGAKVDGALAASLYTLGSTLLAVAIVRPWRVRPRTSAPLNAAAGALLILNLYGVGPAVLSQPSWQSTADALIEEVATSGSIGPAAPRPNIYYVILDGFGRQDVLKAMYSLDLGPFVTALESRGFAVPAAGRANYSQTYLSLASSLNLSYLDSIAARMGDSSDRRALDYLIQHNALMGLARRAGYRVLAIGSDYSATLHMAAADECLCEQYGFSDLEIAALNLTPLRALPLDRWTYGAHADKIEHAFRHIENAAAAGTPQLVFAHVLAPHPPFVFTRDGHRRAIAHTFGLEDGSHYLGGRDEYVSGYREQAAFVAARLLRMIDTILQRSSTPPVIVLHGDHGPGSMWNWDDVGASNASERLGIFSAYRFPGDPPPQLSSDISPVSGMRTLANRYLGTTLPDVRDRSFASTWKHPYRFAVVEADSAGVHE